MADSGKYLDITTTYCVTSCYADDSTTMINTAQEKCVTNCESYEFQDTTLHQCFRCDMLKVEKPEYTNCIVCTSKTVCT